MSVISNLRKMISGTIVSQVIVVAALPVLAKIYSPDDFGFYALLLSLVSIIGMVSSFRLERTLFILKDNNDYFLRLNSAILMSFIMSVIISLFFTFLIFAKIIEIELKYFIFILIWGWLCSLIQIFSVVCSTKGQFKTIGLSSIVRSLVVVTLQFIFFYIFDPKDALVYSAVISCFFCVSILSKNIIKDSVLNLRAFIGFLYLRKFRSDCFYGFFQSAFATLNNNLGIIFISQLWGYKAAGLFMFAEKLTRLPINLISNNLRPVLAKFYQSEINQNFGRICKISLYTSLTAIFIVTCIFVFSDFVIMNFMGDSWFEVSDLVKILSIWVFFNFVALPFQSYNMYYINMKHMTQIEFITLSVKVILLLYTFYSDFGISGACIVIVFSSFLNCLLNILITFRIIPMKCGKSLK